MTGSAAWRLIILAGSLTHTRSSCLPKWWIGSLAADKQPIADTREIKKLSDSSTRWLRRPLLAVFSIPLKWTFGAQFQIQFGNIPNLIIEQKKSIVLFWKWSWLLRGRWVSISTKIFSFLLSFLVFVRQVLSPLSRLFVFRYSLALPFPSLCSIFSSLRDTVLSED